MDINQNQQTNTFLKGMNTDTSDFLLQGDLYRYAENIRIITDTESNTGEIHLINGNECISTGITVELGWKLLSMDSIRDIIVFIIKESNNVWSIYTYRNGTHPQQVVRCTDRNIDNGRNKLSTILRWESDENIKLYIVNGKDPILQLLINKQYGDNVNYSSLFKYTNINLPAPQIEATYGGTVPSAVVQYAYRLYSENNAATTMSVLSEPLSLYKNENSGYGPNKITNKAVKISIGEVQSSYLNRVLVYRISYQLNGQLPVISLIADRSLTSSNDIIDIGRTPIEDLSVAEFLSLYNIKFSAETLESKGDYLFLGNITYAEDTLNDKIKDEDVRCFSKGNYTGTNQRVIDNNGQIPDIVGQDLHHYSFLDNFERPVWTDADWGTITNSDGYNGIGKYFKWKYVLNTAHTITPKNQIGRRTYRRNEVYRFGVRFFDKEGNPTSVKWLCDILMPPMFNNEYAGITVTNGVTNIRELGVEFKPVNTNSSLWDEIEAYEIVQCERTLSDSYTITQGICGKACSTYSELDMQTINWTTDGKTFTPSGFFSLNDFEIEAPYMAEGNVYRTYYHALSSDHVMMFASPEYVYQPDDIKEVFDTYKKQLKTLDVVCYEPQYENNANASFTGSLLRHSDDPDPGIVNRLDLNGDTSIIHSTKKVNGFSSYNFGKYSKRKQGYFYNPIVEIYNHINVSIGHNTFNTNIYSYTGTTVPIENTLIIDETHGYSSKRDIDVTTDNRKAKTIHYFNYYIPESIHSTYSGPGEIAMQSNTSDISYVEAPEYSEFAKNDSVTILNAATEIKNDKFINWTNPILCYMWEYGWVDQRNTSERDVMSNISEDIAMANDDDEYTFPKNVLFYPTGSGGKCVLFETDQIGTYLIDAQSITPPQIHIRDVIKPASPYGGYTEESIQNSTYLSVGGYANKTEDVSLYQGDTFIKFFTYNAQHEWFDPSYKRLVKSATVYAVPLETSIDIQALFSEDLFGVTSNSRYVQDKASVFDSYSQSTDAYMYNTAYSVVPNVRTWYPDLTTEGSTSKFDTRVHFSERKINNEKIDNWLLYKSSNFLDVDSRYGEITSMKLFKDRLIFWQDHATGLLSVNERILINDINDTQLQLGTGGVLERFDYLSQIYGMKKGQHVSAVSNNALYWWDGYNKEILQYSQDIVPLSSVKNISNYIKKASAESDIPTIVYDDDYKEVLCNVVDNQSVVYSEYINAFLSIYKEDVLFWCNVLGTVYESKQDFNGCIYKHNSNQQSALIFDTNIYPLLQYVVNTQPTFVKTFDIQTFGGRFYGGEINDLEHLYFDYKTPLKQHSVLQGGKDEYDNCRMTNLEYDYRLTIPRNGEDINNKKSYGDRMRGKTMQCEFKSDSNNTDFSLQYIITKFRMSWT